MIFTQLLQIMLNLWAQTALVQQKFSNTGQFREMYVRFNRLQTQIINAFLDAVAWFQSVKDTVADSKDTVGTLVRKSHHTKFSRTFLALARKREHRHFCRNARVLLALLLQNMISEEVKKTTVYFTITFEKSSFRDKVSSFTELLDEARKNRGKHSINGTKGNE